MAGRAPQNLFAILADLKICIDVWHRCAFQTCVDQFHILFCCGIPVHLPGICSIHHNKSGCFLRWQLVKVLLYVCCVLAASVLLAVVGWQLADDVLALTKPDEEITITVPENATVADVSRELKEKGLIEYEWLFRFYCLYSHAERKIQPGTYELNHLYDYHALVNGMTPSTGLRATTEVTIPEGYECEDIFALLEEAGVSTVSELEQAAASYEFDYSFLQDLPRDVQRDHKRRRAKGHCRAARHRSEPR